MASTTPSNDRQRLGFLRQIARRQLRGLWILLSRVGVSPRFFLHNALDRKVGMQIQEGDAGGRVVAVCDFIAFPLSYDIVFFLAAADAYRRQVGAKWMDVVFLAHDSAPLNPLPEPGNPVENGDYRTFIHNIGLAATQLFPSAGNVLFFSNRADFVSYWRKAQGAHRIFPQGYSPYSPDYAPNPDEPPLFGMAHVDKYSEDPKVAYSLSPPTTYKELVRSWLSREVSAKKIITITLRETPYQLSRNSNIAAWQELIDHYRGNPDIRFILLRDYFSVYADTVLGGDNVTECPEAVLVLPFRAALYEEATLNLFVPNGPAALCYYNSRTRYIVFDVGGPEISARPEDLLFQHGLHPGENIKGASPFQRLIWAEEEFTTMRDEVDSLLDDLSK